MINFLKKFFISAGKTNMEKEIYEQPEIIAKLLKKYINKDKTINIEIPENIKNVALIACGSSYHCASIAANFLRDKVHCNAQAYYASEFSLVEDIDIDSQTLYIFISQSGETSDTNKSLDIVRVKTNKTLAVTNTANSTLYNNAKYKVLIYAGSEKSIASTKAMSAQLLCLFLISAKIMQQKELPVSALIEELYKLPHSIENALEHRIALKNFSNKLIEYDNAAVLASGMFYPLAKEGALKIKETSYINTTAYPTGEFLHGHIAILNKKCAVISLVNNFNVDFTVKVLERIRDNYNSDSLIISAFKLNLKNQKSAICLDTYNDIDFMFSSLILLQILALETAKGLYRDVDKPFGLTKIVK